MQPFKPEVLYVLLSLHDHCQEVSPRTFYFLPRLAALLTCFQALPSTLNLFKWKEPVAVHGKHLLLTKAVTKFLEPFFLAGYFCTLVTSAKSESWAIMCFNRQSLRCEAKFIISISDVQNSSVLGQQLFGDSVVGKWGIKQEKRLRKDPFTKIIVSKSTQLQYVWRITQIQSSMELTHLPQISLYLLLVYIISYFWWFFSDK